MDAKEKAAYQKGYRAGQRKGEMDHRRELARINANLEMLSLDVRGVAGMAAHKWMFLSDPTATEEFKSAGLRLVDSLLDRMRRW